ncbi:MAG: hypothetical protein ABF630_09825 [Liquorilactobacillus sp.]|uniref:hypothetical protein n=1 Tax=Liquorilactobacillus nagelii TaxID=82688 RepID=UPI0039EA8418
MAQKRMISQMITETDKFYMLPPQAQALYLHLSVSADDDGFIDKAITIARNCGASINDVDELVNKGYLIKFDDGVFCLSHWRINNNKIQPDRYRPTLYQNYYAQLTDEQGKIYELASNVNNPLTKREQDVNSNVNKNSNNVNNPLTKCKQDVNIPLTQNRLDKTREDKINKNILSNSENQHSSNSDVPEDTIRTILTRNGNDVNSFVRELTESRVDVSQDTMKLIGKISKELRSGSKNKVVSLDQIASSD